MPSVGTYLRRLLTKRELHASVHQREPDFLRDVRKDFNDDELDAIVIPRGRLAGVNLIIGEVDACRRGLTNQRKRALKR